MKIHYLHILNYHVHSLVGEFPNWFSQSGLLPELESAAAWRPPGSLTVLSPHSGARGKGLRPNLALAEPVQSRLQRRCLGEVGCLLELHPFPCSCFLTRFVSKALPGRLRRECEHQPLPAAILERDWRGGWGGWWGERPPPSWRGIGRAEGRRHLGEVGPAGELCEGRGGRAILGRSARFGLGRDGHGLPGPEEPGLGSGHCPAPAAADTPPPAIPSGSGGNLRPLTPPLPFRGSRRSRRAGESGPCRAASAAIRPPAPRRGLRARRLPSRDRGCAGRRARLGGGALGGAGPWAAGEPRAGVAERLAAGAGPRAGPSPDPEWSWPR